MSNSSKLYSIRSLLDSIRNSGGIERLNYIFSFLIILITLIKITLIGKGFLAFPDEFIYRSSEWAWGDILAGNLKAAVHEIFSTQGRPGEALLKIIPCAIQMFTASIFKMNYSENSYPMFFFNFALYCCILIVHYRFSKLLFNNKFLTLLSVLVFCSVSNSFLYLRHVLPYDTSLLILYIVLYKIAKHTNAETLSLKNSFFWGIFSFFGLIVYPGFFPLFFTCILFLFFNRLSFQNVRKRIYNSSIYILGSLYCLISFELLSNYGGRSYIEDTLSLSQRINQGSFEESFSFIVKYLFEVEGLSGLVLMTGILSFCFLALANILKKNENKRSPVFLLFMILFGLFFSYAFIGWYTQGIVFYGRLLHQYYPFICIFTVFAINELVSKRIEKASLILFFIAVFFSLNFALNFINYSKIVYPREVAYEFNKKYNFANRSMVFEYSTSVAAFPTDEELNYSALSAKDANVSSSIVLVNFCYFYPAEDLTKYKQYIPESNFSLIVSKPYFLNYKAYQYEGFNIIERENISKMDLQIKIFAN